MTRESVGVGPDLQDYIDHHSEPPTQAQAALIDRTAELGGIAQMQIGRDQGAAMQVIVGALAPRLAVEIGTFTGYSSLAIAGALPPGGRLICCDRSEEWTAIAREHWELAGLTDRIELRLGPALETLRALPTEPPIDFAFIDADKTGYIDYYEELVPRLGPRGVIAVDNTLWSGAVIDDDDDSADTVALRAFNDHVADDPRTVVALTPIGDGLTLIRPR